ncbi:NnrS family protein [Zoogloeaceae bacterium G21618-S1]|nr:NnrS family protein [Zoogloeaceae bacterium G21618-S1]
MLKRLLAAPILLCAFRPLFLLAAVSAVFCMAAWLGFLLLGLPLPAVPGGPVVWHAHELLFGFTFAAIAGFVLTAVPEFVDGPAAPRPAVLALVLLWLGARLAWSVSGVIGPWPAAVFNVAPVLMLIALVAPLLWRDPARRHLSILWALLAWLAVTAGFYADLLRGEPPMRSLHASVGVVMVLIVVVMSRISMRVVNSALDTLGETAVSYLARPPRRHLAVACIVLFTLADVLAPGAPVAGWLALAAAAALFNLQGDWHLGRVLLRRWVLMLYTVYVVMAVGYALIGVAVLTGVGSVSGGRHLLTVGALGLSIFVVMNIAGRIHTGRELDTRRWIPIAAGVLLLAAVARAAWAWWPADGTLLWLAGGGWVLAFGAFIAHYLPLYWQPRPDGGLGCEGVMDSD